MVVTGGVNCFSSGQLRNLEAIGRIQTYIPSFGIALICVVGTIKVLSSLNDWIQKILSPKSDPLIVGDSLSEIKVQGRRRLLVNIRQKADNLALLVCSR